MFEEIKIVLKYICVCFFCLQVFVASYCDDDPEKPFIISKLHKIIDRFEHIVSLHMVLPDTNKGKVNTSFPGVEPY